MEKKDEFVLKVRESLTDINLKQLNYNSIILAKTFINLSSCFKLYNEIAETKIEIKDFNYDKQRFRELIFESENDYYKSRIETEMDMLLGDNKTIMLDIINLVLEEYNKIKVENEKDDFTSDMDDEVSRYKETTPKKNEE